MLESIACCCVALFEKGSGVAWPAHGARTFGTVTFAYSACTTDLTDGISLSQQSAAHCLRGPQTTQHAGWHPMLCTKEPHSCVLRRCLLEAYGSPHTVLQLVCTCVGPGKGVLTCLVCGCFLLQSLVALHDLLLAIVLCGQLALQTHHIGVSRVEPHASVLGFVFGSSAWLERQPRECIPTC